VKHKPYRVPYMEAKVNGSLSRANLGGFVGFERTPLFADSFDLLVLCYSQQCSTLSAGMPVQFGYCV